MNDALRVVTPMIWQRLPVHTQTSLADLHNIIQICMGWEDHHLHSFHIYGEDYGVSRICAMHFNNNAHEVPINDFRFEREIGHEYTFNVTRICADADNAAEEKIDQNAEESAYTAKPAISRIQTNGTNNPSPVSGGFTASQ